MFWIVIKATWNKWIVHFNASANHIEIFGLGRRQVAESVEHTLENFSFKWHCTPINGRDRVFKGDRMW